ncbi:MAG: PaaI family thioesterase [Actinomycetota bacterium]
MSDFNERGREFLPGHMGIDFLEVSRELVRARIGIERHHLAPNGFLHAGTLITLADSCCGYGTRENIPEDTGFTTIELKSNFLSTALEGDLICEARPFHLGRTTQVWDAEVTSGESGKTLALFRCTQMVLPPR